MEIKHPILLVILLITSIIIYILFKKKNKKYLNGSKIANTKYIMNNDYYKQILKKYNLFTYIIKIVCILSILCSSILISRLTKVERTNINQYNRDIFLCMDVSKSVDELNLELVQNLKETVKSLKGERFGISIFNTSSVVLVPLTDDYEYVNTTLDKIKESIETYNAHDYNDTSSYYKSNYIMSGTLEGNTVLGSSLIGDGLASCIYSFSNLEEERSRIIIFSTDNDLNGKPNLTLNEASLISRDKNIKVFGIEPKIMKQENHNEFLQAINNTGGKFYEHSKLNTKNIVNDIEKTSKSLLKKQYETKKIDIPQIPFIILIISISSFIIIKKKVIE